MAIQPFQPSRQPKRSSEANRSDGGFSLIDLLLAVTILGILTSAATLSFDTSGMALEAAVRAVVADAAEAQQLAIQTRQTVGLRFDIASNSYWFVLGSGQTPKQAETSLRTDPNLSVAEAGRLLDARADGDPKVVGATLTYVAFGSNQDLLFDPDGSPQLNGLIILQGGNQSLRIRVRAGSGRIVVTQP